MSTKRLRPFEQRSTLVTIALLPLYLLANPPGQPASDNYRSPLSLIADSSGKTLYISETTTNRVAVFDTRLNQVVGEISVGERPVGLALSGDESILYVTSAMAEGAVQVINIARAIVLETIRVGHTPVAVIPHLDGKTLYVCNQFSNSVGVVDLDEAAQVASIAVPREPIAAALTESGGVLLVANHLPAGPANTDHTASVVSVIDTTTRTLVKNIELPDGSTNLEGIAISPDSQYAYVTHILARYKFPTTYLERGWVNTNAMTVIDVPEQKYVNTVLLDDAYRGAANPHGIVCTADGVSIVISHAGTHELSVIDRAGLHARLRPVQTPRQFISASTSTSGRRFIDPSYDAEDIPNDLTFMTGIRRRLKLAGNGPRGLTIIGATAYAAEYFTDSLGIVDIGPDSDHKTRSIPLAQTSPMTTARKGEMLFHDASPSFQNWHSCASCHSGNARACGLNWDLLNDGMLNAKNTKSLLLTHQTPPTMATGIRADAETAVQSGILYIQFAIPRRAHTEALNAYLKSLEPVASPYLVNGAPSQAAQRGHKLFQTADCIQCHSGPLYTDGLRHRVGTETEEEPRGRFDTPTLIEAWRTAPYLHDGRATTVRDVLTTFNPNDKHGRVSTLTDSEVTDLIEYVLTR